MAVMPEFEPFRSSAVVGGRRYETLVLSSVAAANAYMVAHEGWGVILYDDAGSIHLARMDDKGQSLHAPLPARPKHPRQVRLPHSPPSLERLRRELVEAEAALSKAEAILETLSREDAYLAAVGRTFYLGRVGGSGRNLAGLNRRRERALERTIDHANRSVAIFRRVNVLRVRIERLRKQMTVAL